MSFSLDFNNISTWESVDPITACMRLSSDGENGTGYNPGALRVSADIFKMIENKNERAHFFLNCEKLGLRSWKLFFAYKYPCHEDYTNFIQCVLKSDEVMINALREREREKQM